MVCRKYRERYRSKLKRRAQRNVMSGFVSADMRLREGGGEGLRLEE